MASGQQFGAHYLICCMETAVENAYLRRTLDMSALQALPFHEIALHKSTVTYLLTNI